MIPKYYYNNAKEVMTLLLDHKMFLIKEQVDFLRLAGIYDIYEPDTGEQIGTAKEEPGGFIKLLRLVISKIMLPNKINVYDSGDNNIVLSIQKPFSFLRSKVSVFNRI